jgi:hypothetical protein
MGNETVGPEGHAVPMTDESNRARQAGPNFGYNVARYDDFESLLNGTGVEIPAEDLPDLALDSGRILLQARGGAGKTVTLDRIAETARKRSLPVLIVSALDWASRLPHWEDAAVTRREALDALLDDVDRERLRSALTTGQPLLVLIDGLNEVPRSTAALALEALDLLAVREPNVGVVVADRLVRRELPSEDWMLATLTPVSESRVREILGSRAPSGEVGLLSNPFYLEQARLNPLLRPTGAELNHRFLRHAVTEDQLPAIAKGAFQEYARREDRFLDRGRFSSMVGADTYRQLVDGGVLVEHEDVARFVHHLLHDYVASLHLVASPRSWDADNFDALTLRATSFDALAMLIEQVDPRAVDGLLRKVYDWNFYASAYLLEEDRRSEARVSREMEIALTAMLAERKFDRVITTALRVTDALRVMHSDLAQQFLRAKDLHDLLEAVGRERGEQPWFAEWQEFFTRPLGARARKRDTDVLATEDGVMGWTAANVLRRSTLNGVAREVERLASNGTRPVRWRAVHVLGAHPGSKSEQVLTRALTDDDYHWVKYGALRSLIEIAAAATPERRQSIFLDLAALTHVLLAREELLREVEQALLVRHQPDDWSETAGLLLEKLWAGSDSVAGQDRWRRLSARLRLPAQAADDEA